MRTVEQLEPITEHVLHGGMYSRTVRLLSGVVLTGVTIKIPTLLIVSGDLDILDQAGWIEVRGYGVLPGSMGRKSLMVTRSDVQMTMVFPTSARTVEEAEREFTDEFAQLMSRQSTADIVTITGEGACQD